VRRQLEAYCAGAAPVLDHYAQRNQAFTVQASGSDDDFGEELAEEVVAKATSVAGQGRRQ
jgi:hypothetical protein